MNFCVTADKAANLESIMGASKRVMEHFLLRRSADLAVSTARFANVAFSDGSLLYCFYRRIEKEQPLSALRDVRRYLMNPQESGQLCMMSCLLGENRDLFFPKLDEKADLKTFAQSAVRYLRKLGYEAEECAGESEARAWVGELKRQGKWPVYFFDSDTSGEKWFEDFYTAGEEVILDRFASIGVINFGANCDGALIERFKKRIGELRSRGTWTREEIQTVFYDTLPELRYIDTGKFLDGKMWAGIERAG
jgi:hypothetical protein